MNLINWVSTWIIIILFINVFMAGLVVFFERRKPSSTWAWLLVLFFIPVFGFLFYMCFGRDGKKEKVFKMKAEKDYETYIKYIYKDADHENIVEEQKRLIKNVFSMSDYEYLGDLAFLNINSGNWLTENNSIQWFRDGTDKFNSLLNDIKNAKNFIHMEYYIIRKDNLGKEIIKALTEKAKQGVKVRLLFDGMGCNSLNESFFKEFKEAGAIEAAFLPPFLVRINYRDHRKIVVIDGDIGYIGGFNIGDEYLGKVNRYGKWRDTHIRIEGDAVNQLQLRFIMDWNFTVNNDQLKLSDYLFPKNIEKNGVVMQIVSSGPDTRWKNIRNAYFKMINEAEDHIYIATPYFVPDDGILEALKVAALSGIDVRIIIPANPDHMFVYWASMSYLGELLETGVKCYQYEDGFIHSKVISIDGSVVSVGTANMDIRSFALNFEVNAFIYNKNETKKFEDGFFEDLGKCMEITKSWYNKRSALFKFRESVSRLISPML